MSIAIGLGAFVLGCAAGFAVGGWVFFRHGGIWDEAYDLGKAHGERGEVLRIAIDEMKVELSQRFRAAAGSSPC